jgi:teichuronic acid biosynthesis glycosyltransferase TuaC
MAVVPASSGVTYSTRQIASLIDAGAEVRTFSLLSRTSVRMLLDERKRLRREIREFRPNLVHAHFGTMTAFICAISSMRPLVITFRGSDLNGDPDVSSLRSRIGRLLSQVSALRAKQIICVSSQLRDRLWWRRDRVTVIPTGVNLQLFHPAPKEPERTRLGWEQDAFIVVFNGSHRPRTKGLEFVQAAVRIAELTVGAIHLLTFNGSVPADLMPARLNAADCLVLASRNEGSPNVVKEALACNLPVVATDVGDVRERLQHVQPSRVVEANVHAFGKALAEVLLEKRRSNGREHIGFYSEAQVANSILSVFDAVVPAARRTNQRAS